MSGCLCVCAIKCIFFLRLSLTLKSYDQFQASHCPPHTLPLKKKLLHRQKKTYIYIYIHLFWTPLPPQNFFLDPLQQNLDWSTKQKLINPIKNKKINYPPLGFFCLHGNGHTICIGHRIQCLPYEWFFWYFFCKLLGNLLGILCFNLLGHLFCIVATLVLPKITGVKTCCIKFCLCKKRHFASVPHCSAHCEPLYFFSIPNFNI